MSLYASHDPEPPIHHASSDAPALGRDRARTRFARSLPPAGAVRARGRSASVHADADRDADRDAVAALGYVLYLYRILIRDCREATLSAERGDLRTRSAATHRARTTLGRLRDALDPSAAPELAAALDHLYAYLDRCLCEGDRANAVTALRTATELLETLNRGWQELAARRGAASPTAAR